MASREQAAIFLKHLGDQRGKVLLRLGSEPDLPIMKRNVSILIHGYKTSSDKTMLLKIYKELEKVLIGNNPESRAWYKVACGLDF